MKKPIRGEGRIGHVQPSQCVCVCPLTEAEFTKDWWRVEQDCQSKATEIRLRSNFLTSSLE